jgi:hypothetical protein
MTFNGSWPMGDQFAENSFFCLFFNGTSRIEMQNTANFPASRVFLKSIQDLIFCSQMDCMSFY